MDVHEANNLESQSKCIESIPVRGKHPQENEPLSIMNPKSLLVITSMCYPFFW